MDTSLPDDVIMTLEYELRISGVNNFVGSIGLTGNTMLVKSKVRRLKYNSLFRLIKFELLSIISDDYTIIRNEYREIVKRLRFWQKNIGNPMPLSDFPRCYYNI